MQKRRVAVKDRRGQKTPAAEKAKAGGSRVAEKCARVKKLIAEIDQILAKEEKSRGPESGRHRPLVRLCDGTAVDPRTL